MSRYNDEHPPRKGTMRPHSFDIGVHEHQSQQDRGRGRGRGRGVYKSGSGTFMFASTSMSAALDNWQFYPKVMTPHAVSVAEDLTFHAGNEACLSVLNRMTSQALSACIFVMKILYDITQCHQTCCEAVQVSMLMDMRSHVTPHCCAAPFSAAASHHLLM